MTATAGRFVMHEASTNGEQTQKRPHSRRVGCVCVCSRYNRHHGLNRNGPAGSMR